MNRGDLLDRWILWNRWSMNPKIITGVQAHAHAALNQLADLLDRSLERPDMSGIELTVVDRQRARLVR